MTSTIQVCQFADSPTAPRASNNNTASCLLCPVLPLYFWTLIWLSGCQYHSVSSVLYGILPHSSVELAWSTHPYTLLLHSTDRPVSAHNLLLLGKISIVPWVNLVCQRLSLCASSAILYFILWWLIVTPRFYSKHPFSATSEPFWVIHLLFPSICTHMCEGFIPAGSVQTN